ASPQAITTPDNEFVDLQAWLLETEPPKNPRMTAEGEEQSPGTVQTDFTQMLETFKRGVAEHVDESDSDSQYDLGVAYMEMGLFGEAIAQFQKAIRGNATPERRLRAYESLGQCFIEQGQYDVAVMSLRGALQEPWSGEDKLVGVLYLLGYASEFLSAWAAASAYYQRVFAIDIHFRDVEARLQHVRQAARSAAAS
ncbi:MAG TPA: tetratricopeptide repeat protein, partial [Gemmatimonadaceae bacterium]|nr:tetratricopeptide repeat protein [Gemmatimonadaceae bacterium]